jgi:hypothetical protein
MSVALVGKIAGNAKYRIRFCQPRLVSLAMPEQQVLSRNASVLNRENFITTVQESTHAEKDVKESPYRNQVGQIAHDLRARVRAHVGHNDK